MNEKAEALRLLDGLENGTLAGPDAAIIAGEIDPVFFYVVVSYLRECYPASDPAANAVLGRVVELTSKGGSLIQRFKDGEQDPISRWFEQFHGYRGYRGRSHEFMDMIAEKLDS